MTQPSQTFVPGRPHWWQWLTVLSLDAPPVALVWQRQFAQIAGITLSWYHYVILGIAVWLVYAMDRWIEGWRLHEENIRTQRHYFYLRRRWPTLVLAVIAGLINAGLVLHYLTRRELAAGLLFLLPILAYLLSHQWLHRNRSWRLPKELCIAVLFALGTALATLSQPHVPWTRLVEPVLYFGLLCFTDCVLIARWEYEVDVIHGETSLVRQFQHSTGVVRTLPWVLAALGLIETCVTHGAARDLYVCGAISGILLGVLDRIEPRIGRERARSFVDATLLTPGIMALLR